VKRIIVRVGLACLMGFTAPAALSQENDLAIAQPTDPRDSSPHLSQLRNVREGLCDPDARPEERRRWADMLLSYDSPGAKALTIELLGATERPEVQRAICGVVADRARHTPERLDADLVQPLLDLLGADAGDLRVIAAEALADFSGADVPARLGELASQDSVPLVKRLAAIDALAPNTHRREVVGQLISLLDAGVPAMTERVVAALEPATPAIFGVDLDRWRQWWDKKSRLSEEAWLAEQLRIYRDRSRHVGDRFQTYRATTRQEQEALTARMRSFQRELFRAFSVEQREAKLVEWLGEPLPVVKATALALIKARMADEGKRPSGNVLNALLDLLERGSPEMRREALEIVQNLNNPAVMDAVLTQLERETDPVTRYTLFKAIGKLDNPVAIPFLIREIAAPDSPPDCVREAAIALGRVAPQAGNETEFVDATGPLRDRYHSTAVEDAAMRAALLAAMAGLAHPAFTPEFRDAMESDDATVLRPAIKGMVAVEDTSKLPRLRMLMAHTDPMVRLAAIDAVGQLGREDADLESLLTRLNPTIETNDLAQEAAWRGFRALLSNRSMQDRIRTARRLRDMPDLEGKYLGELADILSTPNGDTDNLDVVLDRLTEVLIGQGRYGKAIEPLRQLYDLRAARPDPRTLTTALRLLEATLRDPGQTDVAALIRELAAGASNDGDKAQIVDAVTQYLQSDELAAEPEHARSLLQSLRRLPPEIMGEGWTQRLDHTAEQLDTSDEAAEPLPSPGG
jgi:HEAT repeat protein